MLSWALTFLIVAIIAGVLGFGDCWYSRLDCKTVIRGVHHIVLIEPDYGGVRRPSI